MAINHINVDLAYLTKELTFRSDSNYIINDIHVSQNDYYNFDELFEIVEDDKVDLDSLGIFEYAEIGNVSSSEDVHPVLLDMDVQNELNNNYFKKIKKGDIIKVQKNDILISKVRPYLKKIIFIDDAKSKIYYTSAFIHLRPRKSPRILFYLLKGHFINYVNSISRQGKGYPTLSDRDLHYMKFCKIDIDKVLAKESKLLAQIELLENQIRDLKKNRISDTEIINEVFKSYFQWDIDTFTAQKAIKSFITDFSSLPYNYDMRISAKFHRPAGAFVYNDIEKTNCLRIKNFISEPIVLGASVSPEDFDACGNYYYISMATVKNFKVELDDSQLLSDSYIKQSKIAKKKVQKGDIIMTRSGAAIGKFALVEDDIHAIHADFTMRIRLHNIDHHFAYYYFRSVYFQYLIEINYKGLQNNNIFPNQVQEFPIPDIPLELQCEISDKIKSHLEVQEKTKNRINCLRNQIDEIIGKTIKEQ